MCAKCTKCTKCAKYTNVCKMCKVYNVCKVRKVYRCVQNVQSIPMCTQYHCHISQQWVDQWHKYSRPYSELISTYSTLQPSHIFLSVAISFPHFLLMSSFWRRGFGCLATRPIYCVISLWHLTIDVICGHSEHIIWNIHTSEWSIQVDRVWSLFNLMFQVLPCVTIGKFSFGASHYITWCISCCMLYVTARTQRQCFLLRCSHIALEHVNFTL